MYPPGRPQGPIERIIVHHSATDDTSSLSWNAIHKFHTQHQGWDDIGYHAGCELVRDDYIVVLGRPEFRTGSHTLGHNHATLGFCFVGNYDLIEPSDRMLTIAAQRWFIPIMARYKLSPDDIMPHWAYARKSCPGKLFNMDRLRNAIRRSNGQFIDEKG